MADLLFLTAALITGIALLLSLVRFMIGPSPADRILAFDVITIISITGIVISALVENRGIYLDVAIVYALLSFLGVIIVARFLEKGL